MFLFPKDFYIPNHEADFLANKTSTTGLGLHGKFFLKVYERVSETLVLFIYSAMTAEREARKPPLAGLKGETVQIT